MLSKNNGDLEMVKNNSNWIQFDIMNLTIYIFPKMRSNKITVFAILNAADINITFNDSIIFFRRFILTFSLLISMV